jgi:RNA polymerase sigma factor (sigma-70 family)
VDYEIVLAGNFGEPRPWHFHGGIDIKTGNQEGKKIYAVAEGYVSHLTVNKHGFGNAIYVSHPDGLTSVYCHLKAFSPRIKAALRRYQYQHETSEGDARFSPLECPVSNGQLIALSGNTGNSMGPHLHLEIHDTETPFDRQIIDSIVMDEALAKLTPPQREVVILHFIHRFTAKQISRMTKTPLPTIKSRIAVSRKRLKELLEENRYE